MPSIAVHTEIELPPRPDQKAHQGQAEGGAELAERRANTGRPPQAGRDIST